MNATHVSVRSLSRFAFFAVALLLASCGGGGGGGGDGGGVTTYTVGGTVSMLSGTVTLQNNGGDNRTISAEGPFTFPTALANSGTYNVTVLTQPASQTCSVSYGSGTISGANVSNVAVACGSNTFRAFDHNGAGVSGVNVYLDGGAAPIGATDATGSMPFSLTGVHTLHFYKAGSQFTSHFNRDWTAVSGTVPIGAQPYPGVATTGPVNGTISNTNNGDPIRVLSRRISDGTSSAINLIASGTSAPYNLTTAPSGTSNLFVFPSSISFPAGSSFVGYSPDIAVPSSVNPSLVRGTATSFTVTGAGGFPAPGSIAVSYGATANQFYVFDLLNLFSASSSGATLAATTVNVPPLNLVYPNASYYLRVSAFSVPSTFGGPTGANFQARFENRGFPTYADMVAAAATQDIVLTDDTMSVISPVHNATNVSLSPTFAWSRAGSPDYVEVNLFEYDPVRLFYAKFVWYARAFGNTFSVTPPATITLNPNSSYQYIVTARRDLFDGAGVFIGNQRNGWINVKFSTGATTPP